MSGFELLTSGLSALIPRDNRLTFTLLVAGTGALALYLEYYYRDKLRNAGNWKSRRPPPEVTSKIESGNDKLEEAIRYYESALVDMQREGVDGSQRSQIRAMLLRAYEIQAILSPDEFNLRSSASVMIESGTSVVMNEIVQDNLAELELDSEFKEFPGEKRTSASSPNFMTTSPGHVTSSPGHVTSLPGHVTSLPDHVASQRPRSDSLSSVDISDFYEAFDFLDEEDKAEASFPEFYKDQLFLHKVKGFTSRKNRYQQFSMSSPHEYLVKVQCLRLAFDRLMKVPSKRRWMVHIGRQNTSNLLRLAGADSGAFCAAYDEMMVFVGNPDNLQPIKDELKVRRIDAINIYDIVIDFCLLDSFDDLDRPPSSVTSVLSNSWISQSLRKTMLSTAVWGMIGTKSRRAQADGFLSRFYAIMGVLSPALAWGFLGDDPILHPICSTIRYDLTDSLMKVFDENLTDYSSLETLSDELYNLMKQSADNLTTQLDQAFS